MPPSPTGLFHVGTVRTMLFNWLFARRNGGRVVLRFEDTDVARSTEAAVEHAESVLRWLGIDWDDGPYRQTERYHLYAAAAEDLIAQGAAYRCYCTEDELKADRAQRQAASDGNEFVPGADALFTEAHFEDAADGGHERTAPGEEHPIDLTAAYA